MTTSKKTSMSVAEYITIQIEAVAKEGKLQSEIAEKAGFNKPNIITMIKQGKTKLPMNKIGPMARALGVDAGHLFRLTMQEYEPDTWDAIENIFGTKTVLTENELAVVEAMRKADLGTRRLTGDEVRDIIKYIKSHLPKN